MTRLTKITIRSADRREEDTMHLFDADAKEEEALCGAGTSACDLTTVQYCLRQLIDGIPVGNICPTCMAEAACWAEDQCRKLETDATLLRVRALRLHKRDAKLYGSLVEETEPLLKQAREYRHLAGWLARNTGSIIPM